jgi:hypothetical protein
MGGQALARGFLAGCDVLGLAARRGGVERAEEDDDDGDDIEKELREGVGRVGGVRF